MDSQNEVIAALYVALAHACGGRRVLNDANDILKTAVESGAISSPNTRRAISALIAATARAA
jgi:hypothetical protein